MIAEYLDNLQEDRKEALIKLQTLMLSLKHPLKESMAYKMPTYSIEGQKIFAFASQKNYISFYVMPYDMLDYFKEELKNYNCGKSCIRMKQLEEADLELIHRIAIYCLENHENSALFGKY